tara:strand:- start:5187 stop:5354 length:168 start_codon:yes stop_codon:yes gene_type:complete
MDTISILIATNFIFIGLFCSACYKLAKGFGLYEDEIARLRNIIKFYKTNEEKNKI